MKILKILLGCGLTLAAVLCGLAACTPSGSEDVSGTAESPTGTQAPTQADETEPETEAGYADIGDGRFLLDREVYYCVSGRVIPLIGSYDFDADKAPVMTVTADDPEAVSVADDGSILAKKPGDFTLTVREETYGTTATARLVTVGALTDNVIISVPVWRGVWVNEEQFGYMRDAGVDMVVAVSGVETRTWDVSMDMLDTALSTWHDGRGVFVLAHSTRELLDNVLTAPDKQLERIVSRFADKPAFAGYHLIDEPYDCNPYSPVQNKLGVMDPNALTDVNFLPGGAYASMTDYEHRLDDYCRLLDDSANAYLSFDNYPFPAGAGAVNEDQLFGNFEAVRKAGLATRTRTAFYLQAVGGFNNAYRRPDQATLTYHAASALAYGFKWIKYWSWFVPDYGNPEETYKDYTDAVIGKDGKPTDLYPAACDLHTRVHTIGPVLVRCEADEVYHTGRRSASGVYTKVPAGFFAQPVGNEYAILSLLCDRTDGRQYLMVVNKDMRKAADMSFRLAGVDKVIVYDTRTGAGTETALSDHTLTLRLEAGDFAFIGLPEGDFRTAKPADANLARSGQAKITADASEGRDGCFVVCALDGQRTSTADSYSWRVPAGQTGSMLFEFDQPQVVNRVDLYPADQGVGFGAGFPRSVTLSAETEDGWVEIYKNESFARPTTEVPVIRFEAVTVKALRLTVSGGSIAADLAEIEIYHDDGSVPLPGPTSYEEVTQEKGQNVALGKKPIASGSAYESVTDGWGLAYLTDGIKLRTEANGTNGWMAQGVSSLTPKAGTVWGGVDLGGDYKVSRVVVYPRESGKFFPAAYDIQISLDGEDWTTVASEDDDTITEGVGRTFVLDETVHARFVRICGRKLRSSNEPALGGYLMQVSEIEVYWD
ncbi:MAG: discoidin domain-containing protein [Clostridia bacterium]|nr:discoidin domain-containing protein [Clostridia bacterium]